VLTQKPFQLLLMKRGVDKTRMLVTRVELDPNGVAKTRTLVTSVELDPNGTA